MSDPTPTGEQHTTFGGVPMGMAVDVAWDDGKPCNVLADLKAVSERMQSLTGHPVINVVVSEPMACYLQGKPTILDLTGDPVAVKILRRWRTRPWDATVCLILADRIDEMGNEKAAEQVRNLYPRLVASGSPWQKMPSSRQGRQRRIRTWTEHLSRWFGDFMPPELPF